MADGYRGPISPCSRIACKIVAISRSVASATGRDGLPRSVCGAMHSLICPAGFSVRGAKTVLITVMPIAVGLGVNGSSATICALLDAIALSLIISSQEMAVGR